MKKLSLLTLLLLSSALAFGQLTLAVDSLAVNTLKLAVFADGGLRNVETADSSKSLLFTQHLWIGGYDKGNNLHQSYETYRQGNLGYTPGPISNNPNAYLNYNRLYKVSQQDVAAVVNSAGSNVPQSVADWPAHGDTTQGEAWFLAPFVDTDNNGVYNPSSGDYPAIKGDVAIFSMFNDSILVANNGLGIEVHSMTYAYNTGTIQDSIVYTDYRIINRSIRDYHDAYMGVFADFDLGNPTDDIVGTNINANAVFSYNADNDDERANGGFGNRPATAGIRVLAGPKADIFDGLDNDKDGCIDGVRNAQGICITEDSILGIRERISLSGSMYFQNNATSMGNPDSAQGHYNYLNSKWKDGMPLIMENPSGFQSAANGDGYVQTGLGAPTVFMFPGNSYDSVGAYEPSSPINWYCSPVLSGGDLRSMANMGPFSLKAGEETMLQTALIWARAKAGSTGYDLINKKLENLKQYASNQPSNPFSLHHIAPPKEFNYYYQNDEWFVTNSEKTPLSFNILNLQGQLVNSFTIDGQTNGQTNGQIPLASLPHGIYLIQLPGSNQTFKVLK